MNKLVLFLLIGIFILGCNKKNDDPVNDNNPFLTPPIVNINLNLNLPQYNPLRFPGNSIILTQQGIKGIVVYNVNNDLYTAFDLTDPNHIPSACSKMTLEGIVASCTCGDDNSYDIVTGQSQSDQEDYPMLQYRINRSGDNITVTN
ncbi:hypothetical protein KXJ69_02835 [Aureisphaera sp. CAU 1614]|uniref:Rieske domain-containing protein n=1 Tax=Halomarinibacterium sedimenti TaxID=2857106 RepID=A0A9X1JWH1_9FLAO|nr:hypothetical protein [Halomarinibacterium sedimenti]MBW2937023.1 hypothetical protein [Halomarinibacterium sedimenti]